jgi:RNA polymerase sigma factor (sigma-70 family)
MNKRQTQSAPSPMEGMPSLPRLTSEQEHALIQRARAGENVRDQIILALQRRIGALAAKYARPEEQEDFSDLVNSANVALLKRYQQALSRPNPFAYLLRTAQSTMINYYHGYGEHTQRERALVLSLDMPRNEQGTSLADFLSTGQTLEHPSLGEATASCLLQAVAALPEKQRLVIERHYGLGQEPQSLNMIKEKATSSAHSRSIDAHYQHNKALAALRASLAAHFPQFAEGGVQ